MAGSDVSQPGFRFAAVEGLEDAPHNLDVPLRHLLRRIARSSGVEDRPTKITSRPSG
jgi:hypothetical protein